MTARLLAFLGGEGRVTDEKTGWELRLLSAADLLRARREAVQAAGDDPSLGLWLNACVLARAVFAGGAARFSSGAAVLEALPAEELQRLAERYETLSAAESPDWNLTQAQLDDWTRELGRDAGQRLRWRVLRAMGVLPSEPRARAMTPGDYLYCALNLLLDRREQQDRLCPACRSQAEEDRCPVCGAVTQAGEENPGFDTARFEELKGL